MNKSWIGKAARRMNGLLHTVLLFGAGVFDPSVTEPLPGTKPLSMTGDLSAQMVEGIHRFLLETVMADAAKNGLHRALDDSKLIAAQRAAEVNRRRRHLERIAGAVDQRIRDPRFVRIGFDWHTARTGVSRNHEIFHVRWPVLSGVHGEGILCRYTGQPAGPDKPDAIVILPDADDPLEAALGILPPNYAGVTPPVALGLLDHPCDVLIVRLIDRSDDFSGNRTLSRFTNQPHREWVYRQAYEMGRHVIGYEVQIVRSALECLEAMAAPGHRRVFLVGYGEGAIVGNYAVKIDGRFAGALLSGFDAAPAPAGAQGDREIAPLYRNVFGGWIACENGLEPKWFLHETRDGPALLGPRPPRQGRGGGAAPFWGYSSEAAFSSAGPNADARFGPLLERLNRARGGWQYAGATPLVDASERPMPIFGGALTIVPSQRRLPTQIWSSKGPVPSLPAENRIMGPGSSAPLNGMPETHRVVARERQVGELVEHTQRLMRQSEYVRQARVDKLLSASKTPAAWNSAVQPLRRELWQEVLGKVDCKTLPMNPRSRKTLDRPKWTGYEVVLDVWPGVFAWGYLLVPRDIKPGERRPVVVCQHGLEGLPADTIDDDPDSTGFKYYKAFAARLAERGFVVFAPHNPYRGQDKFRVLQRIANPLGLSLFSIIIGQHDRILDFLCDQPFVDAKRIGFYGLSYGGKTAMRAPAVLDRYCLSICSADFNDWVKKCVTVDDPHSYMFTGEYEMPEWNLGFTFNYAEMAACICPRPFMVERGHDDGVAPDEWVAYEYAKVRRLYDKLGIGDRTAIEFFNGPHTINAVGTFQFLHRHLQWPEPRH